MPTDKVFSLNLPLATSIQPQMSIYKPSPIQATLRRLPKSPPPDCLEFLNRYPSQLISTSASKNLRFYRGEEKARPDGVDVHGMMAMLDGNFEECESNHG
jgi:hypothetical protein